MKKTTSPILRIGLLMFIILSLTERFIIPVPDWLAIPILILAVALVLKGGSKKVGN